MTEQKTYTFENLQITKTIIRDGKTNMRFLSVDINRGEYWETITPAHPDYSKAIKLMLNKENGFID